MFSPRPCALFLYLHVLYRICPNFWGVQFSRIAISKHFAETIVAYQEIKLDLPF